MVFIGVLLLVALMVPVVSILVDSPIGKAMARRLEGPYATPSTVVDLARKVEVLETEVADLSRAVETLREENQFLQKLIEESPARSTLPPAQSP